MGNEVSIPKASNFKVDVGEDSTEDSSTYADDDCWHHGEDVHLYVLIHREQNGRSLNEVSETTGGNPGYKGRIEKRCGKCSH